MKHAPLLVLVLLSWTVAVVAEDSPELIKLRNGYKGAVERATKPLRTTYLAELVKLRDGFARAAKLEAANGVQAEIDEIMKDGTASAAAAKGPDPRWFMGKAWGTGTGSYPRWVFAKDGNKGEKWRGTSGMTATFTWELTEDGLVKLMERAGGTAPPAPNYIRFESRTEAWVGSDPSKLEGKLHLE